MMPDAWPLRASGYFTEEMDGEQLLYRLGAFKALHLNETASLIWKLCDGTQTVDQIIELLSAEYPEDAPQLRADITLTIEQLEREGALIELRLPRGASTQAR